MKCVIFANGDFSPPPHADSPWRQAELIIATDGGARHCHLLQVTPHLLIGDMDSIPPWLLEKFAEQGSEIHRFPARKDKSISNWPSTLPSTEAPKISLSTGLSADAGI